MNEQALNYSYELFKNDGYTGTLDQYKQLISSDKKALDYSYSLFKNDGYSGSVDDFSGLISPMAIKPTADEQKKNRSSVSPFVDGGSELTKFDPRTGQVVQDTPAFTQPKPEVKIPEQKLPARTEFQFQPGKPLPEQIPSAKPDVKQIELETNPIVSFGKKFWETLSKQIPSSMSAKAAPTQNQFVERDMRLLKSIADVPDDELIEMPSLTDPRGGNTSTYKAGEYKKRLAEKIGKGNKATQASIELALKLNKDLSNSDVISSLTQVNDGYDLLNFISSSIGQTVAQVPLAIATGGGMSYAMESGNIYLETVKEIADKEGITPLQVIQQGKDQVALAEIGGALSGALDLFGAKKILDAFGLDNIKKDIRKKALTILVNSQVEGATEVGQEFVSRGARGLGVQGELKAPTLTEALDSYAAGMFGAAGIQAPSLLVGSGKAGSEEIVQPVILNYGDSKFGFIRDESGKMEMTKELDTEEQAISMSNMLSKSYKGLQFTVEEIVPTDPYKPTKYKIVASEIETKPIQEDAIQEQAAGQVPVQPGAGVSQEVAQGVAQAEPQVTPQEGRKEEKVTQINIEALPTEDRPSLRGSITTPTGESGLFNANVLPDGTAYIANIQIGFDENAPRGKGYGTNAYIEIGKKLKELGYNLESTQWDKHTSGISPQALRVWEKLTELGYAKVIGEKENKVYNRETGAEEVKTTPVYEFVEPTTPQVTPQEGQEKVKPAISEMAGESVTVRIGNRNVSGIVEVDEGGKATITEGSVTYEIPSDSQFSEFSRPVNVTKDGDFVVNGDSFNEARIVLEDGKKKALLVRQDGTTKAVTNPRVVEEIEYNIALASLEEMNDADADNLINQYEQQRKTEKPAESAADKTATESDEDRKLREAFEEIDLIEEMALMELEDVESQAKLVEHTPRTMKEAKTYLVKKNPDGTYQATLNGRKVARKEVLDDLGKLFEQRASEDISKLQDQTNKLKQEVEEKLFGKEKAQVEPQGVGPDEPLAIVVNPVNTELRDEKIEGKLFNEQEARDYQELIDSKSSEVIDSKKMFGQGNESINQNLFNYDNPIAEKNVNGVNVRITEGLIEGDLGSGNRRKTYLLYADGKVAGKFYSVSDAKKVVNFIEANLVKSIPALEGQAQEQLDQPLTTKQKPAPKKSRAVPKRDKEEIISRPAFTPITLARQWLLSGGKLRSIQSEENKVRGVGVGKGVREETGMGGIEMRQLVGVIDNKRGVSIEVAAERIYENLNEELQASIDPQDIRDAIIEVVLSEDRKTWIDNQDRETSEDQDSAFNEYMYSQLTDQERADYDQYEQEKSYNEYRQENAKKLAKEYDRYVKSKVYQDYIEQVYERNREGRSDAQNQNDGRGQEQGADGETDSVQEKEQVEGTFDDLLKLNPKEKGTGQRALDYLDNLLKDYDDIEGKGLGVNLALPVIKKIIQGIRALVKTGMSLNDAIKRVAKENGVSVRDVISNINSIDETLSKRRKVTVDEMAALKDQIKLEARAAREAKADLNTKRRMIADAIKKTATEGNIGVKKVEAMLKRLTSLNVDSPTVVNKFIDYAFKVLQDAEYASRLSKAKSLKSSINKISMNKDKFANLRDLGSKFVAIDPSMLTSTELVEYNEIADKIYKSIQGSTLKGKGKLVDMVVESDANTYIDGVVKKQQKQILEDSIAEMSELLGVELTQEEYLKIMASQNIEDVLDKKYKEADTRAAIEKSFNLYSAMIDESITSGKDPFTGEDVQYSGIQKKTIEEFTKMDINLLSPRAALEAVDALMNFMNNGSIAKMTAVVSKYNGQKNMIDALNDGVKSRPIKKYFSKGLGKVLLEQTANINLVFERVFGGFNRGQKMEEAMGIADLVNGKAKGQKEADVIVEEYIAKYFKTKPNKQDFNTAENNTERGMGAVMSRNINGTDAEITSEFNRRKKLVKESITELEKGNEQEVEKAKIYQEVYDKILSDSNTVEDVQSKMDKTNLEAVEFWQDKWREKYQELSDVALGVYNKVLDKDTNYTTDRYSKLSSGTDDSSSLLNEDMAFLVNTGNAGLYKKETGVLMSATRPKKLPTDAKSGEANRYIDLSFDSNNSNAMYDALVDINTAGAIRQIDAAMNSSAFRKIMANQDDANLVRSRISLYVNNIRNKNPFSNNELKNFVKRLNRISAIGVGQSLGGITQPIKQTIPIIVNTVINAGSLDVGSIFDKSKQDFINRSGRAIANRGIESRAQVSTLNKMVDEIAKSRGEKLFRNIEMANQWVLQNFLVKWDVGIARASWMTYYEQSLKRQGINPKGIDYNTHEVNEKAANYAQRQVDRQQNVSDADMAGALLSNKEPIAQVFTKMLMPFSSFRMNQSARLGSDMAVLMSLSSDMNDRKIAARSVIGFAFEMATFRALSAGVLIAIYDIVKSYIVDDEDEEQREKKIDLIIKGQLTSTVSDVFSPIPIADPVVQGGASVLLESYQDMLDVEEEDRISIYGDSKKDALQSFGTFGIAAGRALQLYEMGQLATGKGFKDNFNRTKYVRKDYRDGLKNLFIPAVMSNIGLAPSEVNSIVRTTISEAKKNSSTKESGEKTKKSSGGGGGGAKPMNKTDMKRYFPEQYDQLYGPNSPGYEIQQQVKEFEKQQRDLEKSMKDQIYGVKD